MLAGALRSPLAAVGLGPGQRARELVLVVDALVHAAGKLAHVDRLDPHAQVFLEEGVVDRRAGDAHRDAAQRQVRLATHRGDRQAGTREAQQLLLHVPRDGAVAEVLHVVPVDAVGRQALLVVPGQHRRQINRARPLGAVEAPDGLGHERVHVHRLGAVAPAGGHGDREADAGAGEFVGRAGRLGHAADAGVGDHALDRLAAAVPQVGAQKFRGGLRQAHRRALQRLANAATAPVDRGANADLGQLADVPVGRLLSCSCAFAHSFAILLVEWG